MSSGVMFFMLFLVVGVIYFIVSSIGNKIVDKGSDALSNRNKQKKNLEMEGKSEKLSDRYK